MTKPARLTMFLIPIDPDYQAQISVRWPMTPAQWDRMLAVLEAMRPALTYQEAAADPATDSQWSQIIDLFAALGIVDQATAKATAAQILKLDHPPESDELTHDQASRLITELIDARARGTVSRD